MNNKTSLNVQQMLTKIDELKKEWLKKEINLVELTIKLNELSCELKNEQNYKQLKNYIENVVILDENIKTSGSTVSDKSISIIPILTSLYSTILALEGNSKIVSIIFAISSLLMAIGIMFITFPILKKHSGKYSREKSFYEFLLKIL